MKFSQSLFAVRTILVESIKVYGVLLKIMIPALLVVKVLEELGAMQLIGAVLAPVMYLTGLPALLGVVWATTLLTNIFSGIVVFVGLAGQLSLSVEQVTVLGTLMLIGHSIPIEGAVARRAGVPWWVTIVLRVGGALLLASLLHLFYTHFNLLQEPATIVWSSSGGDDSLTAWVISQAKTLGMIYFVILSLIILLNTLRLLGLERLMHIGLVPVLRVLGIGRSAANVTVVGVALGLSYGAGLLIRDLDQGVMNRRDAYLSLCFLGLLHSIIEDTLLILALGADLSGILWARLIFSFVVIAVLARLYGVWEIRQPVLE
ncbi:hypothetical protein [Granulosicoccus antarcticus]|uniref:hypothetical protein n=1 Tax=Granulosicoccus antarcticus TaxID=437505 RepID=UPI00197AEFA5|nr:hypothetical protein [Granulosicoccus antarcticus]